jgi:hypothetical protein
MLVSDGITLCRNDYTDDSITTQLWDDASMVRKYDAAHKQACNRANLIFDDSTAAICEITLVNGQASYSLHNRITVIENMLFDGDLITHIFKENMQTLNPTWRTDTGMTGNPVYAVISGRSIRFSPVPDATDAGKKVYLEVYRLPKTDITLTTQGFEIPEENQRDLLYWVLHECYKKQDADAFNQETSNYWLARFNQIFGEPVSAKVRQHQFESPREMQIIPQPYVKSSSNFKPGYDWDKE